MPGYPSLRVQKKVRVTLCMDGPLSQSFKITTQSLHAFISAQFSHFQDHHSYFACLHLAAARAKARARARELSQRPSTYLHTLLSGSVYPRSRVEVGIIMVEEYTRLMTERRVWMQRHSRDTSVSVRGLR